MKIACAYIRVSTDYQLEYSPDSQIKLIKEYAEKNNMMLPNDLIYADKGISGRQADKRPEFKKMLLDAKQNLFDVILIYNTSRFARNHEESIVYRSMLKKQGIELISITQPNVDPKTDILMNALYAVMDERYSMDLSENVKRGMTEKAMRGEFLGAVPYGYKIEVPKTPPIIDRDKAKIVQIIFDKFTEEMLSTFYIAKYLNEMGVMSPKGKKWSKLRVQYVLKNEFYAGTLIWNKRNSISETLNDESEWIIKDGNHKAMISKEQFNKAQDILNNSKLKKHARPTGEYVHWLSSMLRCSNCGKSLAGVRRKTGVHFQCCAYQKGQCIVSHGISERKLVPAVLSSLQEAYLYPQNIVEYKKKVIVANTVEQTSLNTTLSNYNKKLNRIQEAYEAGVDTLLEYKAKKERINNEIQSIKLKLNELNNLNDNKPNNKLISNTIQNVYDGIVSENTTLKEKHALLKSVVDKIIYYKADNTIKVFYYF